MGQQAVVDELLRKVPPHSMEAERSVLGALMIDKEAADDVAMLLRPEDFYKESHGQIYATLQELRNRGEPPDVVLLKNELERKGILDACGGAVALAEIADSVPTSANVEHYARIVKDRALLRALIKVAAETQRDAFEARDKTEEILDRSERRMFDVTQKRITSQAVSIAECLKQTFDRINALRTGKGSVGGLPSGYVDLDENTLGFHKGEMTILAARPSMGKCVAADTEIVLEDGSMATIEEIVRRRAARLLTLDDDLRLRVTSPSAFVDDGLKPVFRVTTKLGRVVETTATHPFLTMDGWKPLATLSPGVAVAVPAAIPVFGSRRVRHDELDRLARTTVHDQRVPAEVFTLDRAQLALFLDRLLGTGSRPAFLRAMPSARLARQLQHILLRFGVVATVRARSTGTAIEVARARRLVAVGAGPSPEVEEDDRPERIGDVLFDAIVSIEPLGPKRVYDLTIPETHNFVANDVCVHNTTFALNLLRNMCMTGGHAGVFFSLEMPRIQVASNLLCSLAKVEPQALRGGYFTREEEERLIDAAEVLDKQRIFIDDQPWLSTMEFRAKARRLRAQEGIEVIMIDYLQLMSGSDSARDENRQQEVSEISRTLKAVARELDIPVIALSQLSRKVEDRPDHKPRMSDLRECVTGDTLAVLADGTRAPIRDLVGTTPRVLAMASDRSIVEATSDKVWKVGRRAVFDVRLQSGRTIRATARHRLFTDAGWTRVGELGAGARVGVAAPGVAVGRNGGAGVATLDTLRLTWDPISRITSAGMAEVYDLTVPGPASWLADGIVSHNSGSIEQDADMIMLLHREEYYKPDKEEAKNRAQVIVAKNRNGPTGEVELAFFKNFMRFENLSK